MQKQICIVTGANGFLGKELCPYLEAKGLDVIRCVRTKNKPQEFETGDLALFKDWSKLLENAHTVIHLAAKVHDMSNPPLEVYMSQNRDVTYKLAEEAKKYGVKKFIFLSSIKVNGEFTDEKPFTAEDTPHPQDPYGFSKLEAEKKILALHEPGIFEVIVIRPCLIYGRQVKANFRQLVKLVKLQLPLPFASVQNKRSLVSLDNLIDFIDLL